VPGPRALSAHQVSSPIEIFKILPDSSPVVTPNICTPGWCFPERLNEAAPWWASIPVASAITPTHYHDSSFHASQHLRLTERQAGPEKPGTDHHLEGGPGPVFFGLAVAVETSPDTLAFLGVG